MFGASLLLLLGVRAVLAVPVAGVRHGDSYNADDGSIESHSGLAVNSNVEQRAAAASRISQSSNMDGKNERRHPKVADHVEEDSIDVTTPPEIQDVPTIDQPLIRQEGEKNSQRQERSLEIGQYLELLEAAASRVSGRGDEELIERRDECVSANDDDDINIQRALSGSVKRSGQRRTAPGITEEPAPYRICR